MPSVVRIHPCPPQICGSSSVDRALAFQAEGRGFESRLPLFKDYPYFKDNLFYFNRINKNRELFVFTTSNKG